MGEYRWHQVGWGSASVTVYSARREASFIVKVGREMIAVTLRCGPFGTTWLWAGRGHVVIGANDCE